MRFTNHSQEVLFNSNETLPTPKESLSEYPQIKNLKILAQEIHLASIEPPLIGLSQLSTSLIQTQGNTSLFIGNSGLGEQSLESQFKKPSANEALPQQPDKAEESHVENTLFLLDRKTSETLPDTDISRDTEEISIENSSRSLSFRSEDDFFIRFLQNINHTTFEDTQLNNIEIFVTPPTTSSSSIDQFDTISAQGATIIFQNNRFSYQPATNFNGNDSFSFTFTDINGQIQTNTVSIFVQAVSDDTPSARNDVATTLEDTSVTLSPLDNDFLPDEAELLSFDNISLNGGNIQQINSGEFIYSPLRNYNGIDSFTYTLRDSDGQISQATINISITPVSDGLPIAQDDEIRLLEDNSSGAINLLANDTLADQATIITFDRVSEQGGQITQTDNGLLVYNPNANYNGVDRFRYTLSDSDGQTDTALVTVFIEPISDGTPQAIDDEIQTEEDNRILFSPTDNDQLSDEAILIGFDTISLNGGRIDQLSDGRLSYTPDENFFGRDTFRYQIADSDGQTDTGSVNIEVTAVNDTPENRLSDTIISTPTNSALHFSRPEGGVIYIDDADSDITQVNLTVSHGRLHIDTTDVLVLGNNSRNISISGAQKDINFALEQLVYQPDAGFGGFDRLSILSQDSQGAIAQDNLAIRVEVAANRAEFDTSLDEIPSATGLVLTRYENNSVYSEPTVINDSSQIPKDIELAENPVIHSVERITQGLGALAQTTVINADNALAFSSELGDVLSITGLIYLEANNLYRFAGSRDDALYIELGGQALVTTSGDSHGSFSTRVSDNNNGINEQTFTPEVSGYYTLAIFGANIFGLGELAINLGVNDRDFVLSADHFSFYATPEEIIEAGGAINPFTANTSPDGNPTGGYFAVNTQADFVGIEGQAIELNELAISTNPNDQLISLIIEIPVGTVLFDHSGHRFIATESQTSIDLIAQQWTLQSLHFLPTSGESTVDIQVDAITQSASLNTTSNSHTYTLETLPQDFSGALGSIFMSPADLDDPAITGSGFDDQITTLDSNHSVILGLNGNDTLLASTGDNTIFGGDGNDQIITGNGEDFIFAGIGRDILTGGSGSDRFIWQLGEGDGETQLITDFSLGEGGDSIDISSLLEGETSETLDQFLQLSESTIAIDSNGDGSGFNDLFIELEGLSINSLTELLEHNLIIDTGRSILRGSPTQDTITGRAFGGTSSNEDFYGNGGGDSLFGNGGADRYFFEQGDFSTFIPTSEQPVSTATVRIQDFFTFGTYDGQSEVDAVDFSNLLIGESRQIIDQYLNIDTQFSFGGALIRVDIDGDGSGTDFSLHIRENNLDIDSDLGYTDEANQLEILQLLIDNGNLVID